MLISFSTANFRSFREEQTLNMVASTRQSDHLSHLFSTPVLDHNLLPLAVIYGANGAGKSNLLKALMFVQRLVLKGTQPEEEISRQPFLLDRRFLREPSSFEIRFLAGEWAFSYAFEATERIIQEESLALLRKNGETILFERITSPDGSVTVEAGDRLREYPSVIALAKAGGRANQLFLAGIRDSVATSSQGPIFEAVFGWFRALGVVTPTSSLLALAKWIEDKEFAEFAGDFLKNASTGVESLRVETSELEHGAFGLASETIRDWREEAEAGEFKATAGKDFLVTQHRGTPTKLIMQKIAADHKTIDGKAVTFPLIEESDGTQRLTHLAPALYQLKNQPRVYLIDEIDRSLHPLLVRKFVDFFLQICKGQGSQIILTTHECSLMDLEILRRDELWFAEKNSEGATSIYALSEFAVRTDLRIDKGYLQGRFGAIPFLGNLDRFASQINSNTDANN